MNRKPGPDKADVDRVFGTDVPQASADEHDPDASAQEIQRDQWLRDNVPPHHR